MDKILKFYTCNMCQVDIQVWHIGIILILNWWVSTGQSTLTLWKYTSKALVFRVKEPCLQKNLLVAELGGIEMLV